MHHHLSSLLRQTVRLGDMSHYPPTAILELEPPSTGAYLAKISLTLHKRYQLLHVYGNLNTIYTYMGVRFTDIISNVVIGRYIYDGNRKCVLTSNNEKTFSRVFGGPWEESAR